MTYVNTIDTIKDRTGLKEPFIRKCILSLEDFFKPFTKRGDKNSLLFDESAMQIWDQIKQYKEQDFTIEQIRKQLELSLTGQTDKTAKTESETQSNSYENKYFESLLKEVKDLNKAVLSSKDETIQTKDLLIRELQQKVLLLTDGRPPEVVKSEHRLKEETLIKLEYEVKSKDDHLAAMNQMFEEAKREADRKTEELEKIKAQKQKEKELLQEFASLEGKLLKGKRRKQILEELQKLA